MATTSPVVPTEEARPAKAGAVAQYRQIRCPKCRNLAFSFVEVDDEKHRKCEGPTGCGHVWDAGSAGREVVGWR